ncbi:MAG: Mrp/NBP35 family ATP-binding protein [Alphaproteobacteria bacterium]
MTATPTKETIIGALRHVPGPDGQSDIVTLGLVSEIIVKDDGKVYFSLAVNPEIASGLEPMRKAAEDAAAKVEGVSSASVTLTAEQTGMNSSAASQNNGSGASAAAAPGAQEPSGLRGIAKVKTIIAVASGKGGVGKSTTAANLALAFAANGLRAGLLDADIYGPSMPRLLGLSGQQPEQADENTLLPMYAYNLPVMSMGFLVDEDTPMIWRGPMVQSALVQMMRDVAWGELDIMVVDMPPGTGDAQLTMAQQVPLAGAVIVSTPQDLALIDARKGLNMFKRVNVPLLGIIENMSYFLCPHCGGRTDIFSHGGGKVEADKLNVPFLGDIPLDIQIRETSDSGHPVVATEPLSPHTKAYRDIANAIWKSLSGGAQPSSPKIVMD